MKDNIKKYNSIIIVEDDSGVHRLIQKTLEREGFETFSAYTAKDAIPLIAENRKSILLLDFILPDMNAMELINVLKRDNILLPFIISTGQGDEKIAVEMMKAGALDYIRKETGFLDLLPQVIQQVRSRLLLNEKLIQIERALEVSEHNFRQIFEKSGNGIFVRQNGVFVLANPTLLNSIEYSFDEFYSPDFDVYNIVHEKDKELLKDIFIKYMEESEKIENFEITIISKYGKNINFEITTADIEWNGGSAVLGIANDVTEFYKLKTEMIKAAKNESLNILAGGLAHDFNNILTVVLGNLILVKSKIKRGEDVLENFESIEDSIISGTGLTQQLLSFAKEESTETELISLKGLLKRTVGFTIAGSNVSARFDLPKNLRAVRVDTNQIVQVITNLVINAIQAMTNGGNIKITARNMVVNDNNPIKYLKNGKYVKVSFKDEGCGIPAELKDKIFDPFFTTKEDGGGLGLATCLTILKRHKGWLELDCPKNESGANFVFYIPAVSGITLIDKNSIELPDFKGRILIMDDLSDIRNALKYMFQDLGFNVDTVSNGDEALEIYKKSLDTTPYDIVITDLTIKGGKGGLDIIPELIEINPDIKTIVYSGYANNPIILRPNEYGFSGSFSKPFNRQKLIEILKEVFEK